MKAILLVGGFGTRLRPLTLTVPKQMLPVGHVSMLERAISHLSAHGADSAILSLGYQPDAFTDAFPDGTCAGVPLHYAVEPEPRDTAGAIAFAAEHGGVDGTFVAVNGDVLTDIDITALVAAHRRFGALATIALTSVEDPSRFGVVPLDESNRVVDFVEKPEPGTAPSNWINAGIYVMEPEVLDLIPSGVPVSVERETFPALVQRNSLYAVQSDGYWIDAGTPEAYLQANLDLIDGSRSRAEKAVAASARIDPSAAVTRSVIGERASIGPACRIVDSVIMADAAIGPGSVLQRSIVGGGSVLGEATELSEHCVVGFGRQVDANIEATGRLFPGPEEWND